MSGAGRPFLPLRDLRLEQPNHSGQFRVLARRAIVFRDQIGQRRLERAPLSQYQLDYPDRLGHQSDLRNPIISPDRARDLT